MKGDVRIKNPDVKHVDIDMNHKRDVSVDGITLSLTPISKYKQKMTILYLNRLHDLDIAEQRGNKIKIVKCETVFYNAGKLYSSDKTSGNLIAQVQAIVYALEKKGTYAILKDPYQNHYVFSLNKDLSKEEILDENLGLRGKTNLTVVKISKEGYLLDRIITNDQLQLVPEGDIFVVDERIVI